MSASIDVTGLAVFNQSLRRAVSGDLQRELVKSIQAEGPTVVADMRGAAFTKIQKRAAGSVDVTRSRDGIDIAGGRGADLAGILFNGAEYGGRKSRKVTYATRSRLGTPYIVRRRTTMQFLPHLGREGYMFWPTVRDWLPKLAKRQEALIEKALGGRLMGTIDTLLRVKADASQAVRGLAPLQASLADTAVDAKVTEKALDELGGQHTISLNDQAIENARLEVERLRNVMRQQLRLDPTADTRQAQRQISQLQRSIKTLDQQDAVVDVAVNADASGLLAVQGALGAVRSGLVEGAGGGLIGGLGAARSGMAGLGASGAAAATGVGALAIGTGAFAVAAWDAGRAAADMQTQVAQLDTLTKGLGEATFANLNEWATTTPFTLDEATNSTKKLVAAGVQLSEIPGYLSDIGNTAAATGVPLEQLATVFAQMESSGRASYEDLKQLGEAGIPVWSILSEKLGIATADLQKMASEGKLSADTIKLLRLSLGEEFGGGMADQAATFNGQMSTLSDTMHNLQVEMGTLFLPTMQDLVASMQQLADYTAGAVGWMTDLDDSMKGAEDTGEGLATTLAGAIPGVGPLIRSLGDAHEEAGDKTKEHAEEADRLAASILEEQSALTAADQSLQEHADYMAGLDKTVEDAADHYRELVDNFEAFNEATINARSNVYDYQAAVDSLAESLAESGTFAPDAEEGRANWDNLVGFAEAASARVEDTWRTKGKGAAVALQQSFRRSLHQMLIDAGINSEEAWRLVDQVLKVPHKINMEIGEINDAKLRERLAGYRRERANIATQFVIPEGATEKEAQRILDEQAQKLRPIQARINMVVDKLKPEKEKLDDAANPDGEPRKAKIEAKVDPSSIAEANADLAAVIKLRRTAHIDVVFDVPPALSLFPGLTATPTAGPTAGPTGLATAGARMLTAPTPTAAPWSSAGIPGQGTQLGGTTGPRIERLAPKQTPVAVYLDGVEIAHRIEAQARPSGY